MMILILIMMIPVTSLDSYHCYHQIRKSKSCQISGGQPCPPPGAAALPHLENQLLQAECCRSSKGGIGTFSFVVMTMMGDGVDTHREHDKQSKLFNTGMGMIPQPTVDITIQNVVGQL